MVVPAWLSRKTGFVEKTEPVYRSKTVFAIVAVFEILMAMHGPSARNLHKIHSLITYNLFFLLFYFMQFFVDFYQSFGQKGRKTKLGWN
jgi:hypothetical protein